MVTAPPPLRGAALDPTATRAAAGDREVLADLMVGLDGLLRSKAIRTARRWSRFTIEDVDDLAQDARVAALTALRSYDPTQGHAATFLGTSADLMTRRTAFNLATALHIPKDHWNKPELREEIARAIRAPLSIGGADHDDGDELEIDPADPRDQSAHEAVEGREQMELVRDAMTRLRPLDREVLSRRYGLGLHGGAAQDLAEVGRVVGKSRERVRKIESKALAKLRHAVGASEWTAMRGEV